MHYYLRTYSVCRNRKFQFYTKDPSYFHCRDAVGGDGALNQHHPDQNSFFRKNQSLLNKVFFSCLATVAGSALRATRAFWARRAFVRSVWKGKSETCSLIGSYVSHLAAIDFFFKRKVGKLRFAVAFSPCL